MDKFTFALVLVLVCMCALDVATTTYILHLGGHEKNPYMVSSVSDAYTHTEIKIAFAALMVMLTYCCDHLVKGSGKLCPVVATFMIGMAVINNFMILYQKGYILIIA